MERNIYCLRDIISHNVVMIGDASTDGEFVRNVFHLVGAICSLLIVF